MASSAGLHEDASLLTPDTIEMHRAMVSLIEELEAADWYTQRIEATREPELRSILEHNRNEELEHAAMLLEWCRRRTPVFAQHLAHYLFGTSEIVDEAAARESITDIGNLDVGNLGIGNLREEAVR
jgi:ferritin-like protein